MKTKKFWISLLSFTSVVLMGMSEGYDNDEGKSGHNGSPGEQTCAKSGCHDSFALNSGSGSVSINIPGMTNWAYTPGQTYTVQVTVAQTSRPLFGFGFEALLSSGANAGTLTAGAGSQAMNATVAGNSRRTITHTLDAGLSNNTHTWSFTWVAPATGVPVTLYAVGNAANNNGGDSGDYIYSTSQALVPLVVPTTPVITPSGTVSICNGASTLLSVSAQPDVTFAWFNDAGQAIGTGTSVSVNTADCYYVVATANGGSAQSTTNTCVQITSPDASFSSPAEEYCLSEGPVQLTPAIPGGSFSGPGISGNTFNPAIAGVGNHGIVYQVSVNGCSAESSQLIVVNDDASSEFVPAASSVCLNGDAIELLPVEGSGSFSGPGVNGNFFEPFGSTGTFTISYTNGSGSCQSVSTQEIQVLEIPDASFTGLNNEYCSDQEGSVLLPLTAGGSFSGQGVSGNSFLPSNAGAGSFDILYSVNGANGCAASSSQNVIVNQAVNPAFEIVSPEVCDNAEPVAFVPVTAGGAFSGPGVNDGVFDPGIGAGVFTILHEVGLGSCAVSSEQTITVLPALDASYSDLGQGYCANVDPVILIPVNFGGVFSGNGVDGDFFDPAQAALGSNLISYTLVAPNGCVSESTQEVFVYETANSNFSGLADNYCIDAADVTLVAENGGGFFIGDGVDGTTFSPAAAGAGVHVIVHEVDFVGCESLTSDTVEVFALPIVSLTGLDTFYCSLDADYALSVQPSSAVISGNGISGLSFNPFNAGVGSHPILASFTDENGCTGNTGMEISVNQTPSTEVVLSEGVLTALQDNASYTWFDCSTGIVIGGETSEVFAPDVTGTYSVYIEMEGCAAMSECVDVILIGIDEETLLASVYPIPANEFLIINSSKPAEVRIISQDGKIVHYENASATNRRISTNTWKNGIYILQVISGDVVETRKFTVHH